MFVGDIEGRLKELEGNMFHASEARSIGAILKTDIHELRDAGRQIFGNKMSKIRFLLVHQKWPITDILDERASRFIVKCKELSMSRGDIPMLPWESLLFDVGNTGNVSSTIAVPGELLGDTENARDACLKLMGKQEMTTKVMRTTVSSYLEARLALDRTFMLEWIFLSDHALPQLAKRVQDWVIAALPTSDKY